MGLARIKTNDEVVIIRGKDRGKRGRVLKILRKKDRIVVEGVNIVVRHLRRNPQNPQAGGRQERPAPIHASNVLPWSEAEGKGVRVRAQGDGREKRRVVAGTGKSLTAAGKAKERRTARKTKAKKKDKPETEA